MLQLLRTITGRFELRRLPWVLLSAAVVLALIGALFITSAESIGYARRHLIFLGIAIGFFFCVALLDYRHLAPLSIWLYAGGLAALALLPILGISVNNARRWYSLGPVNLQPSEPMKYVVVLTLATYFTYRERLDRLRDLVVPLVLTVLPMFFIIQQPDLGTSLLFLPAFFGLAFLSGVPLRNLAILGVAGLSLFCAAWFTPGAIKDYQKDRLISFVRPELAPHSPASYNARQATLAVTGGGLTGQGWGSGLLNQLERIPERHTDFIFPVVAEEWGFVRTVPVMVFYLLMMLLIARETWSTPDRFGRLAASGVLVLFAVQSLLHMAISLRLAPITGLTLPLMSYGGSSLVSTFAGFGVVASVAMRRALIFPDRRNVSA